jgi:MoxR-like ATPase
VADASALELARRARTLFEALRQGLVERNEALYLALLAAAAGEHILLVGPPGTAKSELARRLHLAFEDARYFERLLTRFTVPEEIFGPLSLKALERDAYERLTDGYLPSAHVAFLDEIFEANSAILNALLGALNERAFDNGTRRERIPLACVIAASNEISESVPALSDRFLLRLLVTPVSDDGFEALLAAAPAKPPPSAARLRVEDLDTLRRASSSIDVPAWTVDFLRSVRGELSSRNVYVSDRRWRKTIGLLRTSALLAGRDSVVLADLGVLFHCLWQQPSQRTVIDDVLRKSIGEMFEAEPARYVALATTLERALVEEEDARSQKRDAGGPLYRDADGRETHEAVTRRHRKNRFGELLFKSPKELAPCTLEDLRHDLADMTAVRAYASSPANWICDETPNEPVAAKRTFTREHVASRVAQVDRIIENLRSFVEGVDAARGSDDATFLSPIEPPFADAAARARAQLADVEKQLEAMKQRWRALTTPVDAEVIAP